MHARLLVAIGLLIVVPLFTHALSPEEFKKYIDEINAAARRRVPAAGSVFSPLPAFSPKPSPAYTKAIGYSGECPLLPRAISFGSRGTDVTALQKFLIAREYLAQDSSSGYFGSLTTAALKSFQASNDIVASGSVATTGYGAAGPRTRDAIAHACDGDSNFEQETQEENPPADGEATSDEPADDTAETIIDAAEEVDAPIVDQYPTCVLSISPETITAGDDATLSWSTTNATSAALVGIGKVSLNGSLTISPNEFAEYTLRVVGVNGSDAEVCSQWIDVTSKPEPELSISADPEEVSAGGSATVTWSASNAAFCEMSGGGLYSTEMSGTLSSGSLTEETTFKLVCKSAMGEHSEEATVYISVEDSGEDSEDVSFGDEDFDGESGEESQSIASDLASVEYAPSLSPGPDTIPPTVLIVSPADGSIVTNAIVTAEASDDVGVTKVEFYRNKRLIRTDAVAPYTYKWTPNSSGIIRTFVARAYDAAGNVSSSSPVTLTAGSISFFRGFWNSMLSAVAAVGAVFVW